jgi:hypothetical protein
MCRSSVRRWQKAIQQLELLLGLKDQPRTRRAEWLSLIAALHLKHREDPEAGRAVLEQILREFEDTPQAFAARRRLELLSRQSGAEPKNDAIA